jgi:hypothetical protein
VLDRENNVRTLAFAGNFDAITEGSPGPKCPTGATILRDVLVSQISAKVNTTLIAPRELVGKGVRDRKTIM